MNNVVKTKYGNIDLNKLTTPVLELAQQKAEACKRKMVAKRARQEAKAQTDADYRRLERKWNKKFNEVYDLSLVDDRAAAEASKRLSGDPEELLGYFSKRHLYMKPQEGIRILQAAYNQTYNIGKKCKQCGKIIPPSSRLGRTKEYCSNACRQKHSRQKNKNKNKKNNDNSPVTSKH